MIVAICIFFILVCVMVMYVAVKHEPDDGWDEDPLPALAAKAEAQPEAEIPPEILLTLVAANDLDLQI